jgi:outer membrane protein assembly factor BamB
LRALAADADRFYVAAEREIRALDPQTGDVLWAVQGRRRPEEGRDNAAATAAAGAVLFVDGGRTLRRLDGKTGASGWELELGTTEVSSLAAYEDIVYAAVEPASGARLQVLALDARKGKLIWRRAAGGKRLGTVGPEGVALLGAADDRHGVVLLDRHTGAVRAHFRVGRWRPLVRRIRFARGGRSAQRYPARGHRKDWPEQPEEHDVF